MDESLTDNHENLISNITIENSSSTRVNIRFTIALAVPAGKLSLLNKSTLNFSLLLNSIIL